MSERFNELATYRFQGIRRIEREEAIRSAEELLDRVFHRNETSVAVDLNHFAKVRSQFFIATLGVPDAFLTAYEVSGREEFLEAATAYIVAWAEYEKSVWLPDGLIWNDHAIAERILVLADFWRLYRQHAGYEPSVARVALELAARCGLLLAKPGHFTFNTNHGVMQNLALWHYSLAFPTLPKTERYKELAFSRLKDQMQFYINHEGVVLEHSSQYQGAGIRFLAIALRYATLLDIPIPREWVEKYKRAIDMYAHLMLPDGSLPRFGDTGSVSSSLAVVDLNPHGRASSFRYEKDWQPQRRHSLYPVAGYSIWWDGLEGWPEAKEISQLAVTWANFPGHGHRRADEMSLSFWSAGQRWITNLGYWPYGSAGRREAVSWIGSNAPHQIDEDRWSSRQTNLQSFASSEQLAFIDLERKADSGYNARRQVIWKKPHAVVVIDYVSCVSPSHSRTVWTAVHDVRLTKGPTPQSFSLRGREGEALIGIFFGTTGIRVRPLKGSESPFAGWEFSGRQLEAPAVLVEQPCNDSVSAVAWILNSRGSPSTMRGQLIFWNKPDDWELKISVDEGSTIRMQRTSDRLVVRSSREEVLNLSQGPDIAKERRHISESFQDAATKYSTFNVNYGYRVKVTKLIVVLLLVSELFLILYKRLYGRHYAGLRAIALGCWLTVGFILAVRFDSVVETFSGIGLPL